MGIDDDEEELKSEYFKYMACNERECVAYSFSVLIPENLGTPSFNIIDFMNNFKVEDHLKFEKYLNIDKNFNFEGSSVQFFCPKDITPIYGTGEFLIKNKCSEEESLLLRVSKGIKDTKIGPINFDFSENANDYGKICSLQQTNINSILDIYIVVLDLKTSSIRIYNSDNERFLPDTDHISSTTKGYVWWI